VSSPFTTELLAAWRKENPKPVLLVEVALTDPGSRTLKLTTEANFVDSDGNFWEPLIHSTDAIESPGSYLSTGIDLGTFNITLVGERFAYQSSSAKLASALKDYRFQGATVTAWLFELNVVDISKKSQIWKGEIADVGVGPKQIDLICVQRTDWNRIITPDFVTRGRFPRAPEKSLGLPLPLIMGNGTARPLRADWSQAMGTSRNHFDRAGGAIPTLQGVLVDVGRGASGEKAMVILAGHDMETVGEPTSGANLFMRGNGGDLVVIEPDPADVFTSSGQSGFEIPDDSDVAYLVMGGSEVLSPATPASEPRYILDLGNETTYALLDYDASKRILEVPLFSVEPPGEYVSMQMIMGYRTVGGNTNLRIEFENPAIGSQLFTPSASTTPTSMISNITDPLEPTPAWDFSSCLIRVSYIGAAAGLECHVYFVALLIRFKPRPKDTGKVIRGTQRVEHRWGKIPRRPAGKGGSITEIPYAPTTREVQVERPITELDGEFYGNGNGQPDSGGGTYTGVAGAVISRAPDIARYLLLNYLGQAGVSGSGHAGFITARDKLKTWNQRDMAYLFQVSAPRSGEEILTDLARDSLSWVFLNRFTDEISWHVWKKDAAVDYDRTILPDDCLDPHYLKVSKIPKSRIITSLRIGFLWDAYRRALASEVAISSGRSSAGYNYLSLRDEYMSVVTGENDKLDFVKGGVTEVATIAQGDYNDATMLSAVRTAIAAEATGVSVGIGCRIVAGVNDVLDFYDGSVRTVTLDAALYATMEALAAHVTTKMNSVSSNWTCSYSRTTKLITISRSAGTAELRFSGNTSVCATLGYINFTLNTGSPYPAQRQSEEELFQIAADNTLDILWQSGTNGLDGTNTACYELLGFDPLLDSSGASAYVGICPKNNREQALADAESKYNARREMGFEAKTIIDTDTARELRNRIVDMASDPDLQVVTFRSTKVPDLERGRVLAFSSLFDAIIPFPKQGSDGSWSGKKFWVVETRQNAGPARWDTEVTCVEVVA
jgi:hypothetical protein